MGEGAPPALRAWLTRLARGLHGPVGLYPQGLLPDEPALGLQARGPDGARVGRAHAVLDPAHAVHTGVDAGVVEAASCGKRKVPD